MNSFENRKIHVLEAPTTQGMYRDNHFDQQTNAIWKDFEAGNIGVQALALWFYLNKLAGHDREVYCKIDYLMNIFKASKSTVQRWTKELESTGWLVKVNRTGTSNKYWIAIPAEFDVIDNTKYAARLSTVGQELTTGKRSTKAKQVHSVTDEPMELDITNSSDSVTDEPMHSVTDEPMHSVTDDTLNREINNQRNLETDKSASYQGVTYLPGEETGVSSGQDYKESLVSLGKNLEELEVEEISISPLVETKSPGYPVVTKKEEIQVLPLVAKLDAPHLPSTTPGLVDVDEDDLETAMEKKKACSPGYRRDRGNAGPVKRSFGIVKKTPEKALEAPQSVVGAEVGLGDQTVPEKPQKPVYRVPTRNPYHDDSAHDRRVHNAETAHTMAMGKWKQDLKLWESKYGETTLPQQTTVPTPLSEESQSKLDKYSGMRIQAQSY